MSPTPNKPVNFFSAALIAQACGTYPRAIHRRAQREFWETKRQGNRVFYAAQGMRKKLARITGDQARLIRELQRATAVYGFHLALERNPIMGREEALRLVCRKFRPLFQVSERAIWRWVCASSAKGLQGLCDRRPGRSGRKAKGQP